MTDINKYFHDMRFDESKHLGLGDVRITIAEQEELISLIKERDAKIAELQSHWAKLVKDYHDNNTYVHNALAGTGCATVEELRRRADWAMDVISSYIEIDDGECTYCTCCEIKNWSHAKDCSVKNNYYSARLSDK